MNMWREGESEKRATRNNAENGRKKEMKSMTIEKGRNWRVIFTTCQHLAKKASNQYALACGISDKCGALIWIQLRKIENKIRCTVYLYFSVINNAIHRT